MSVSIKENEKEKENFKKKEFSLLLPYYNSDKWTLKIFNKVKSLAKAYEEFTKKIEQENTNSNANNTNYSNQGFTEFSSQTQKNKNKNNLYIDIKRNKTMSNFHKNNKNYEIYNACDYYKKGQENINEMLPCITNYNKHNEIFNYNDYLFNINENGKPDYIPITTKNAFQLSDLRQIQLSNMNKYFIKNKIDKKFNYNNDYNKYLNKNGEICNQELPLNIKENCNSNNNRINFFKINDYNINKDLNLFKQPKTRKQISATKNLRKKQYLNYIKTESENNYMKFYYEQP